MPEIFKKIPEDFFFFFYQRRNNDKFEVCLQIVTPPPSATRFHYELARARAYMFLFYSVTRVYVYFAERYLPFDRNVQRVKRKKKEEKNG